MTSSSQITIPGFSAEQTNSLTIFIQNAVNTALEKHFGLPPPQQKQAVTVPQLTQPPEQEHKPLQQAIAEKTAEKHTEKAVSNSKTTTANTSLRSTVLRQATKQICRDVIIRLSNTPRLTSLLATLPTSLLAFFFVALLALPLGYIEYAKSMEATGQG